MFENRLLRRIFVPKRYEVTGEWRRLLNEGRYALYSTPNIIQMIISRMSSAGHVARLGDGRGAYRVLMGRPEVRRRLGRSRYRWDDNIKMDFQEAG